MAAEEVLIKLFESLWFGHETSTKSAPPQLQEQNPFLESQEHALKVNAQDLTNPQLPTLHVRSISDQSLFFSKTSSDQLSFSPNSVLFAASTLKLQPILSGKVMKDDEHVYNKPNMDVIKNKVDPTSRGSRKSTRRRKKLSKSMSELEFDEVKGFMDLGFVFSEEDKDSSLVSIIPGLQRFGSREDENKVLDESHVVVVSRPYLSEAWDGLEQRSRRDKGKMINWRVPANLGSEIDMKDHLKLWAHSVASTVR